MPEEAKEDSKAGAEAFVRHFIAVLNNAQSTGDTGPLRQLATKACTSCSRVISAIGKVYSTGGRISGGSLVLDIQMIHPRPDFNGWLIFGAVRFGPSTISAPGTADQDLQGGSGPVILNVTYRNERPLLDEWTREP